MSPGSVTSTQTAATACRDSAADNEDRYLRLHLACNNSGSHGRAAAAAAVLLLVELLLKDKDGGNFLLAGKRKRRNGESGSC